MSEQDKTDPPALPSEVWRGVEGGDIVAINMTQGDPPRAWWIHRGSWCRASSQDVYAAWALAERARADKAEREAVRLQAFADLAHDAAERSE